MSLFTHRATGYPATGTVPASPPPLDLEQPTEFATATFALG